VRLFAGGRRFSALFLAGSLLVGATNGLLGMCGPFTDVPADAFCPFVLEIFTLGITSGTTATTYDPTSDVTRLQMSAFLSRTVDSVLRRGSRRAALGRFATPQNASVVGQTTIGFNPSFCKSDGADVWVADFMNIWRVRASDGRLLDVWTAATELSGPLITAMGRVQALGLTNPGRIYEIDPSQPSGAATAVTSGLGGDPADMVFDGERFWTVNSGPPGSVSIVTPGAAIPWTVTTVTAGFSSLDGAVFDGSNVWVTDSALKRLDSNGAVTLTVLVGSFPYHPIFDGGNIWVPNFSDGTVSVVRASNGAVLQTLTGNGLKDPVQATFDGERVLVTNPSNDSVSLWKAADLTPLGSFSLGAATNPFGACSDGLSFWIALNGQRQIARF
jgi:hypothetical protein